MPLRPGYVPSLVEIEIWLGRESFGRMLESVFLGGFFFFCRVNEW